MVADWVDDWDDEAGALNVTLCPECGLDLEFDRERGLLFCTDLECGWSCEVEVIDDPDLEAVDG